MAAEHSVRIVMVAVGDPGSDTQGDLKGDSRVRCEGRALVQAGFDVTLVTYGVGTPRRGSDLAEMRVVRIEVPWTVSDARRDRVARRRAWAPQVGYRDPLALRASRARLEAGRLAAASSGAPSVARAALAVRRQALSVRVLAQRALGKTLRLGWRLLDTTVDRVPTGAFWSHRLPETHDYEAAFGPALDGLQADAYLVHGVELLAVVARASARARLAGRQVPWVYDVDTDLASHQPAGARSPRERAARVGLERRFIRYAAGVVVDSGDLADSLQRRYRLATSPTVVPTGHAAALGQLYVALLGAEQLQPRPEEPHDLAGVSAAPARPAAPGPLVGIGPANMAGQAWSWAKALERELPGTRTEVLMVDRGSPLMFPADELVTTATYGRDVQWQRSTRDRILASWTHALIEAGRPLMGVLNGKTFSADARLMQQAGVKVGLVFHGSELRDPRRHAAEHRWSPFRDTSDEWVQRVQATVDMLRPDVEAFAGPCLVSTPDLVGDLEGSTWLPVVVDCEVWTPRPQRSERDVPLVLHTPSRAAIKGSAFVDEALAPLVAEGLLEYRRIEGVPPDQMPVVLGEADIVLDQFAIGSYGVLACQAMATGTAVIGHVSPEVRTAVEQATGQSVPIVEATPDSLQEVMRLLLAERGMCRAAAQAGPAFVRSVHDGSRSARILAEVMGIEPHA